MFRHPFQEIPPWNTVLGGDHHGIAPIGRGEIVYHVAELMRLHCKNDEILLAHFANLVDCPDLSGDYPIRSDELETIRPVCREVSASRDDRDILPRRVKPRRKKPANRAGTDDTNAHDLPKPLPRAEASVT